MPNLPTDPVSTFDEYADARYRLDYGEARPGDEATVETYERLVLNPAHVAYTEAVGIKRTFREDIQEHVLTFDGQEVATAHPLAAPFWSVKVGGRFAGIAPNEAAAVAHLDAIARRHEAERDR